MELIQGFSQSMIQPRVFIFIEIHIDETLRSYDVTKACIPSIKPLEPLEFLEVHSNRHKIFMLMDNVHLKLI